MPFSVVVTGGNRGIGLELVRQLAASHAADHVFATCRNTNDCQDLKDLQKKHSNVHILQLEVCDEASYGRLVKEVEDVVKDSGLNLLINNAGILKWNKLTDVKKDHLVEHFNTNCVAPLQISRAFLPLLRAAGAKSTESKMSWRRAAIVNITSKMGSLEDNTSGAGYSYRASKAALNMVTRSLGTDLRPEHILAVALEPGWVKTDMGTQRANTSVEQCVGDILSTLPKLSDEQTATYISRTGKPVPW